MSQQLTMANISTRQIVHRTRGNRHGPITRLVSPSDLGNLIKPFVFLDYFEAEPGLDNSLNNFRLRVGYGERIDDSFDSGF